MVRWRHVRLIVSTVQISRHAYYCFGCMASKSSTMKFVTMALVVYAVLAHARPPATGKVRLNFPCTYIGPD